MTDEDPTADLTDAEVDALFDAAAERLREHAEHKLGQDQGCGQCLYCHTCQVRVCSYDVFVYLVDSGTVRHRRFGNHVGIA